MTFQRGLLSGLIILLAEKAARESILGEIVDLLATSAPPQPILPNAESSASSNPRYPDKIGPYAFTRSPGQKRYASKYPVQRNWLKADREKRR